MLGFNSISEESISALVAEEAVVAGIIDLFNNDETFIYLRGLGYTGSYNDMLFAFLTANLARTASLPDLQAAYIALNGKYI